MSSFFRRAAVLLVAVATVPEIHAQATVTDLMNVATFRKAGLHKLTEPELKALNDWLAEYTKSVVKHVSDKAPALASTPAPAVIETCIDDEFEGWDGDTIFKLCNGQIWQQEEYAYTYHYAYRPDVLIVKTATGYKMKVEGVSDSIRVKRLK